MQPRLGFYHILYLCLTALPHHDCLPFYRYEKILHSSYIPNGTWHLERSSHNLKNSCCSIILWHHTQMLPTFQSRHTYPLPYITYHTYVLPNSYRMKKNPSFFSQNIHANYFTCLKTFFPTSKISFHQFIMNIYQNTGEFIWQIKNFILNLHVSIKQGSYIYSQLLLIDLVVMVVVVGIHRPQKTSKNIANVVVVENNELTNHTLTNKVHIFNRFRVQFVVKEKPERKRKMVGSREGENTYIHHFFKASSVLGTFLTT